MNAIDFSNCDKSKRLKTWITLPKGVLLERVISLLHRLYYSIPIYNIFGVVELKKMINYENYFKFSAQYYIQRMDLRYDDVLGNVKSGDRYVAVEGAREMLSCCMAAYILSKKESLDRVKWVPLRLKNIANYDETARKIYDRYCELLFSTVLDDQKSCELYVENVLFFSFAVLALFSFYFDINCAKGLLIYIILILIYGNVKRIWLNNKNVAKILRRIIFILPLYFSAVFSFRGEFNRSVFLYCTVGAMVALAVIFTNYRS